MEKTTKQKCLTNLEYAILTDDLTLVERVARKYIEGRVGKEATRADRELAYEEWCAKDCDDQAWCDARRQMLKMKEIHAGLLRVYM